VFALVGSMIRRRLPRAITLTDYVRLRYGRAMQAYVALISVFYMFISFTAEFTAIGASSPLSP
jgi:SSS family solute:Na+ symporter